MPPALKFDGHKPPLALLKIGRIAPGPVLLNHRHLPRPRAMQLNKSIGEPSDLAAGNEQRQNAPLPEDPCENGKRESGEGNEGGSP